MFLSGDKNGASKALNFTEVGIEYDSAYNPVEIAGKLAFIAKKDGKSFVVYDGQKINYEYNQVSQIADIGGKLAFSANNDKDNWFVVYDGQEIIKNYRLALNLVDIGGKLALKAQKEKNGNFFIFYDGREFGREYDFVQSDPININGELGYLASIQDKYFLVINDKKVGINYSDVSNLISDGVNYAFYAKLMPKNGVNNTRDTSVYVARKYGPSVIVYNGNELGKEYDDVFSPQFIDGRLLYLAKKNGKTLVIYNNEKIGQEYDYVTNFVDINGRLTFIAKQGIDTFIDYNGKKIFVDKPQNLTNANGELAYVSVERDGFHVIYAEEEVGAYDYVSEIIDFRGKPAFAARLDGKWGIYYNGQKISGHDYIDNLTVIGDKLTFNAKLETKIFIASVE